MEPKKNEEKTPTKASYEYENSSDQLGFGSDGTMSSPGTVGWDFDLPPASKKIVDQALQLSREASEEQLSRRKNLKRASPYCLFQQRRKKLIGGSPSNQKKSLRSVNLLREALNELAPIDEDEVNCNLFHKSSHNESEVGSSKSANSDYFDDSFNDSIIEFSQTVEENFVSKKNVTESSRENDNSKKACENPVSNIIEEINGEDDHLFLEIDLNSFN